MRSRDDVGNSFPIIFKQERDNSIKGKRSQEYSAKVGWYGILFQMAGEDVIKVHQLLREKLADIFFWYSIKLHRVEYENDIQKIDNIKSGTRYNGHLKT